VELLLAGTANSQKRPGPAIAKHADSEVHTGLSTLFGTPRDLSCRTAQAASAVRLVQAGSLRHS